MLWWTISLIGMGILILVAVGIWKMSVASQRPRLMPNEIVPDVPYEEVTFQSEGSKLHGWIAMPPNADRCAAVVIAHGWGSNRSRVLRYAGPIYDSGIAVMLFDARSHGDSDPINAPSGLMFRDDVTAAVDFLKRQPGVDPERIAVLGHSMGGFGALLALGKGLPVRAVVTDSTPIRFDTMFTAELKRRKLPIFPLGYLIPWIWLWRSGISRADIRQSDIPSILERNLSAGGTPVLMVHSVRDGFIPADDLQKLVKKVPVEHLLVDSEGHSVSEKDPAFWQQVLPFLKKHLLS
ncbi:alpha/beta hydrolase [Paenibacillus abyssi]|uniref:Lipoprotein n=1 Tax=Paenibacillus abyssi TaxID=1340531 RepID=A0A917G5R9_9BACL|nr:alpha/beta fold hydrolase [Paenibacillus abyssi]GGG23178.1 lipoprotein [Paenibacillus abyssi]